MTSVMLNNKNCPKDFGAEAVNTTCHTINLVYFCPSIRKTPYALWEGKKTNVSYFHIFGSTCYILNDREYLGKFDSKSDISIFLSYYNNSKAYRVYNIRTQIVM